MGVPRHCFNPVMEQFLRMRARARSFSLSLSLTDPGTITHAGTDARIQARAMHMRTKERKIQRHKTDAKQAQRIQKRRTKYAHFLTFSV